MRTYGQKDVYAKEEELFGGITYEEPTESDLKLIYGMLLGAHQNPCPILISSKNYSPHGSVGGHFFSGKAMKTRKR